MIQQLNKDVEETVCDLNYDGGNMYPLPITDSEVNLLFTQLGDLVSSIFLAEDGMEEY
ncbi:MAG: hypothetical protein HQL69_15040 [Magnetococcales bacterium]|nr:hypothetical protein [Magnetococcales bacterium]